MIISPITLPPLPEPIELLMFDESVEVKGFSRTQMRKYGEDGVRLDREQRKCQE